MCCVGLRLKLLQIEKNYMCVLNALPLYAFTFFAVSSVIYYKIAVQ